MNTPNPNAPCPLAVMEAAADSLLDLYDEGRAAELSEARAAVADLVKAARTGVAIATAGHGDGIYFNARSGDADRLRAALAAFGEVR